MIWYRHWSPEGLIFALAFVCGIYQVVFPSGYGFGPGWETMAIARELALTGSYANPFQTGPSGPTAVIAPLFPAMLALLIRLLGDTPLFASAATMVAVLAQSLHAALLPRVSVVFFNSPAPGIIAGVLSAFAFRLMPQWDAALTACALLLFVLNAEADTWRGSATAGVAAGLLLLTNPASVLITVPWIVYVCLRKNISLMRLAGFLAAASLVVLPWMVRNNRELGTFSVKDNFGMTVYASNSDCADPGIAASMITRCYDAHHPNASDSERLALITLGEVGYDRIRTAETVRWVQAHPRKFLGLTAMRILEFWFPRTAPPRYTFFTIWVVTVLSIPGLILLLCRKVSVSWYIIAVAAIYPLLYYVVVSDVRYRQPLLWLSLLCAGYLLNEVVRMRGWLHSNTGGEETGGRN